MDAFILAETDKTPGIDFQPGKGMLNISGWSIPEDCLSFYEPLFDWVEKYTDNPAPVTQVHLKLKYFNTSSSKCIFTILKKLQAIHQKSSRIEVYWYYDLNDTDIFEAGQDYQQLLKIPFKIIRIED